MTNQNIAIEINGGGRNKIKDSNLTIKGDGKGVVLTNTFDNEIDNVTILLEKEKNYLLQLKAALSNINDDSINPNSQKAFKSETLSQVQKIIELPSRDTFQKNILELMSLLSNWITIKSTLTPVIAPYVTELTKLLGG